MGRVTEMIVGNIIRRLLLYIGLVFGSLAVLALVIFASVHTGLVIPSQWVALAVFTGVLLFSMFKYYRGYWSRRAFWLSCAGVLAVHLAIFIPILRTYPGFRPFWFVPIVVVEAAAAGAICGPLLRRPTRRESLQRPE
jgi:hypothetical protein